MPLFDEDPTVTEDPEPSRSAGRFVIIGLLLASAAAGLYVGSAMLFPDEEPAVAERVVPAPPPAPEPEPEPEPPPAPEPSPEPEPPPPPAPPTNVLRVNSDLAGASVFLDRQYLGTTPFDMADLDPGTHRLNVSAEGYEGFTETIEISDDPVEIVVTFKEVRLNEAIPVVHKHRMGSCDGQLIANRQGIHYATSHKDAFSISLDAIEEFEVDYLKRTLHLKVRGGRNYNFTDEQENADALFVFHRDVEKARTRLAAQSATASGTR